MRGQPRAETTHLGEGEGEGEGEASRREDAPEPSRNGSSGSTCTMELGSTSAA